MMEATRSPYMDLAVAVDWYFLEEKIFWKNSCPAMEKVPWNRAAPSPGPFCAARTNPLWEGPVGGSPSKTVTQPC